MKKNILYALLLLSTLMVACSPSNTNDSKKTDGKIKIGIVQLMEHQSLDDARLGFIEQVKAEGIDAEFIEKNAQGTIDNARIIVERFVDEKVDLIFAIATPTAQAAQSVTTEIPILFSAVTDPISAGLVKSKDNPGGNITGTSDLVDMKEQLKIFKEIDKNIKTIGVLYSQDEDNSLTQIKLLENDVKDLGLNLETMAIQNLSDLPQAIESIVPKIDGMYIITDNKIVSSSALVSKALLENKIPSVAAVESSVKDGILVTKGLNYHNLGKQTGKMAKKILIDNINPSSIPVENSTKLEMVVNQNTLKSLYDKEIEALKEARVIN